MQIVDLGKDGVHQFPDDATPDEIQAAIDENFPKPGATFLERQSPLKAAARAAVEGVAGQAKGFGLLTEIMPSVSDPAEYAFMPPDVLKIHMDRARRTPSQVLADVSENPLYAWGKKVQAGAEEAYPLTATERAGVTTKLAGGLGSFLPFLAEGPLGIAGIGLQTAGERLETDFQKEVDKGKSPDDAATATIGKALGAGTLQSALFAVLPPQLRKLGDPFIDRFARGVVSRFLLGRLTHTTEGAALGTASAALDQAVSGELSPEQLADSAFGLGLAQLFMPRGPTRREAEARQAFEGGPSRREIRDRAQAQAWAESFGAGLGPPRETEMVQTTPEVFTGTGEPPRPTFLRPAEPEPIPTAPAEQPSFPAAPQRIETAPAAPIDFPAPQPTPITVEKGAQDYAVQERSTAQIPLGETPQDREALGTRVPEPEKAAVPQAQAPGKPEVAPKPTHAPADLEPALLVNGVPETGGQNHGEIKDTLLSKAKNQDERNAILEAFLDDNAHIFVDTKGNRFSRGQARDALGLGLTEPGLTSEVLADLKAKTPAKEPLSEKMARLKREQAEMVSRNMAKVPADATTIKLQHPDGRVAIVSPDPAEAGKWRLTWFTREGEPWGHGVLDSRDEAIQDGLGVYGKTYGPSHVGGGYEVVEAMAPKKPPEAKLEEGARGPYIGAMLDDSFAEAQKGYPKAKEALRGWSNSQLEKERSEMVKASLNPMFRANAEKVLRLIEDEIEARKALPSPAKSGTVVPAEGTGTVTVRTATGAEASLPRSNEAEKAAAMTAEPGETPGRQPPAGPRSPGLTEEDGVLFAIANTGKIPMFIPPRGMMAEYVRMRKKYRLGGMAAMTAKERDRFRKMLEIFPENFEDDFGVNGEQMRAAYEAAKKAGIENEIFRVVDSGKNLRLDVLLKNLAEAPLGGTYTARELYRRVEQLANAHRERKAETKADVEGQAAEADVKAARAFNRDVSVDKPGTRPLAVADLRKGAQFKLKGTKLIVEALDFDEDGNVISVTLKDGAKYGTRVVEGNVQLRMDEGSLKLPKSAETETEWVTGEIEEPPAAAPAEQPPVASVPVGGEKPPAAPLGVNFGMGAKSADAAELVRQAQEIKFTQQEEAVRKLSTITKSDLEAMDEWQLDRFLADLTRGPGNFRWKKEDYVDRILRLKSEQFPTTPAKPAAPKPAVDLFGNPIEPPKPEAPPEEPGFVQEGLDLGGAAAKPSGVQERPLTPAEAKEFTKLSIKARDARDSGGEQLTTEETQRYEYLAALAGQKTFGFKAPEGKEAIKGQIKALASQLNRLYDDKPSSSFGKRAEKWRENVRRVEKQIRELRTELTEGEGEFLGETQPKETPAGYFGTRQFRIRKLPSDEVNERFPTVDQRMAIIKQYGGLDNLWVAESRRVDYDDAFAKDLFEKFEWYVDGYGTSGKDAIAEAKALKRKGWDELPEKKAEAPRAPAPSLSQSERALAESLAKKYGAPVKPTIPATEPLETVSRFRDMLERAADESKDETELAQILAAAKDKPDESRIAWAVANNPHSSAETFASAKANPALRSMTTDENIASLDSRRAELRKQRGLDAVPAAPEGSTVNGWVKYKGGWYKLDESGKLPMVQRKAGGEGPKYPPANTTISKNLEAEFKKGPAPEDTRSPQEILKQASQVRVKLPEGATVLRVTDTKGKSTQIFIADLNKGENVLRGVDIGKLEAGFINKEKKFEPIKGEVKVTDVGKRQLSLTNVPQGLPAQMGGKGMILTFPEVGMPRNLLPAYHGTPHEVDKFTTAKIGTGEGAQVYGYGLYFAENRAVAESYALALSDKTGQVGGTSYPVKIWDEIRTAEELAVKALYSISPDSNLAATELPKYITGTPRLKGLIPKAQDYLRRGVVSLNKGLGNLYTVELEVKPEVLLDYDKKVSSELLEKLHAAWQKSPYDEVKMPTPLLDFANYGRGLQVEGGTLYNEISQRIGAKGASEFLLANGIKGIRYLDQFSRKMQYKAIRVHGKNEWAVVESEDGALLKRGFKTQEEAERFADSQRTRNYVIFDEGVIRITDKNGKPVTMDEARQAMLTAEESAKEPSRRAVMMGEPIKLETTADIRRVLDDKLSNITQEHRKFFSWLLDKGLLDKYPGLRMEVVDEIQRGAGSQMMPSGEHIGNVSRFLRWTDSDVPLHEFMHHIERFLSPEDRAWVEQERLRYLREKAPQLGDTLVKGMTSDEFMASGLSRDLYHLSNPSEFFAWLMTEKGLKELNRHEATTFVGKVRELIKDLWQGVKRAFGLQPYEDTLWQNILKGKVEYDTAQAIKSNERQASLIRTTEQREKELELGRVGAIGQSPYQVDVRITGAYGDPLRMIAKEADDLNISDGARRVLGMPRKAELWTRAQAAIGGKLSIFGYNGARDWAKDKTPNERWQVTSDALRSLGNEEADWRIIDERFDALKNRITSPGFVKRLESLAKLEWQKDVAVEKEETYRNVRMVNISKTMNEISKAGIDSAQEEILRQDIAAERNALNFATAVGQRMDAIVSKVFPNYWQFGASSRSAQGFYDLYLSVMRGEGTPVTDQRELAYLRFASEVLAVNRYMRERLYWLEAMKREPDLQTAINDFGKAFVQRLQANPGEALRELISGERRVATKAERAATAWKTLNSKLMRDLNDYAKYEEAKEVKDRVQASADWQNLVRTVHTDAEALHVPPEYVEQIKKGYYDEANPVLVEIDPAGKTYTLDFGFTKETAAKAQGEIETYLQSIRDWLYTNKEHPDAPFWQRKLDFIDSVYNTMGVTNPMAVKSLGFKFTRTSWGMPQYLFSQMKIPGAKIVQTMLENWRRSQSLAQNWLAEHTAPIIRAARDAAKGHGYNAFTPGWMQAYREAMFNSIAWRYRHNLPVTEGMTLNGFKVTKADIAYMKRVGFAENQRYRQIENLGVEKAMPDPLLFDKWRENTFSIRRPQEFGTEPLTTVSRERSQRGKLLSTSMAKLDGKDLAKIQALLETEEAWPWVVRWLNERSPDYTVLTPWEPQLREVYNKMNERLPNVAGEPLDTIDSIAKEIAANVPEEYTEAGIKEALLGQMHAELTKHFNTHYKTEPNPDIRVIAATRESSFTRAFQHDTTNSYAYDYGLTNAQELHSFAIDSSMYWLSRFQRGLDGLIKHMSDALAEVDIVKTNPAKLAALKERNRDLFNSGDDFRDYEDLQMQANELKQFRDSIGIWSGQDVKRYEGLTNLYRFVDDMAALVLSGWRTITRVFWGSTVKEGFTMGALERWSSLSTAKSVASMAISLSRVLTVGPATLVARRLKILPKFEKEVSGIAEEWFRTLKFFDAQYPYGLGFKTPTYDTIANVLTMPVTRGGRYMAELSTNRATAMVQRGGYHVVSAIEAPLEFVKTVFPTLGYAVQYDSVCRQIKWWLEGLEKRARRTFNTYEQMGKLDRFDFNNPKNPKNALTPQEVIGDGIFPATMTALAHNNEMFRRGTNMGVNDAIMMFWKRLKETPPDQRGQIHLLSADKPIGTPQPELLKAEQGRFGALATSGLMDIHHAAIVNRTWALRASPFGRMAWRLAGWAVQSTRQWFAVMGYAAGDPRFRSVMMRTLTYAAVAAALGTQIIMGDAEKRIFEELKWLVNGEIDPVKHLGQGADKKETARIAISDMMTYITMLNGYVDSILSAKANRQSLTDSIFVVQQIKSLLQYVAGVAQTHDPLYGLPALAKRGAPITQPFVNRLPVTSGIVARNNARTIIQKWAPPDLNRQTGSSFGMPTATELTPYKEKLAAAIYNGDSIGTAEAYTAFIDKAQELGRPDPENLAKQTVRSLNPYSIALIAHPTDEQRAAMLEKMPQSERDHLLDYENRYAAATQMLGISSEMTRQDRGKATGGTTASTAAPVARFSGGGGSPIPSGTSGRRISLSGGGGGGFRMGFGGGSGGGMGPSGGRAPMGPGLAGRRLSLRPSRARGTRLVRGRLRSRSGRTMLARGRTPKRRRLSLIA